jgi:SAM-dependent methyltransferase
MPSTVARALHPSEKERHAWYAGRRRVLAVALDELGLPADAEILDAGCGAGGNLALLAGRGHAIGVDPDPAAVASARARGLDASAGDAGALVFGDGSFDLVCCLDVLEHVEDDVAVLRELRRVARPGARLLVTVPAFPSLWSSHDVAAGHRRRYTRATLTGAARAAGWAPRRLHAFNALLLPAVAARRVAERGRDVPARSDLTRAPGIAGPLVGGAMTAEAWLVRRGLRPPVGLSLLGVFA